MQLFASLREGSDGHNQAGAAVKLISIHAPVKGATDFLCWTKSSHTNFNPRSREGSDQTVALVIGNYTNFNPRSREGSDTRFLLLMLKNC